MVTRSSQGLLAATAILALCLPFLAACSGAHVAPSFRAETRAPIQLSAAERESLRLGMRTYLESVHGIVEAFAEHKISAVPEKARRAGMSMVHDVPVSVAMKLPPDFVMLSVVTHQKFDALALSSAGISTKGEALGHLRDILANCTACHAMYRLAPE